MGRAAHARARRRGRRVPADRRLRAERRAAAREPARRRDRAGRRRSSSTPAREVDGYNSDCTRTFATGRAAGRARALLRRLPARRSSPGSRRRAPAQRAATWTRSPASVIADGGLRRALRATASATASGWRCTSAGAAPGDRGRRSQVGQRRHGRAGHLPPGPRRDPDRGPRHRPRRTSPRCCTAVHEGARRPCELDLPAEWPRSSPPTSSRTACTSSSTAQPWRIVEFQHVKPGKGGAFVRTKLKALESGSVVDRPSAPARSSRASTPR